MGFELNWECVSSKRIITLGELSNALFIHDWMVKNCKDLNNIKKIEIKDLLDCCNAVVKLCKASRQYKTKKPIGAGQNGITYTNCVIFVDAEIKIHLILPNRNWNPNTEYVGTDAKGQQILNMYDRYDDLYLHTVRKTAAICRNIIKTVDCKTEKIRYWAC